MNRFLALGLAMALVATAVDAQPKPAPPPRIFLSPSGEPFRLGPATPDPLKAWFDHVDANKDGAIDRFEFRADAAAFFKTLDENGDGVIDGFEAGDYERKIAPELAQQAEGSLPGQFGPREHGGRTDDHAPPKSGVLSIEPHRDSADAGPEGKGGRGARGIAQLLDEPEPVTGADLQLDGRITLEEWLRATDRRFELLDTAKTGRLTLDGLRVKMAELQKLQQRRRPR